MAIGGILRGADPVGLSATPRRTPELSLQLHRPLPAERFRAVALNRARAAPSAHSGVFTAIDTAGDSAQLAILTSTCDRRPLRS